MTDIEIDAVSKAYREAAAPALADVTLHAPAGELVAVLGPSGSGKSTLLKLVAGVEAPDRGRVLLGGDDVTRVPAHRRGAVLMFQKAHLFPFLSVVDNVAFGLRVRGTPSRAARAAAEGMLELVELAGTGRRRPSQLSGGEQQRVALARALVTRPRVLLLDEPLSSLDAAVRQTLQETVRRIQRELAVTTVLVTHDRGEAMAMADQVALVDAGRLLASGSARQVFERPPSRRAARLVGVDTFLTGRLCGRVLRTPVGRLDVPDGPDVRDGPEAAAAVEGGDGDGDGETTFAIRPEHVTLVAPGAAPGGNTVSGRVAGVTFRGEYTEVTVAVAGDGDGDLDGRLQLRARTVGSPRLGAEAHVRLPCEHLFPVRGEEGSAPVPSRPAGPPGRPPAPAPTAPTARPETPETPGTPGPPERAVGLGSPG